MRAEPTAPAAPSSQPKKPFPKVPTRPAAPVKLAALNALASRVAAHATTAQALQEVRAGHAATAGELQHAQAEHVAHTRELSEARQTPDHVEPQFPHGARERLAQALEQPPVPPAPAVPWASGPTSEGGEATSPASRVDSALKLVERIEVLLRSGRPQLELSVGGAFQAEVLLERTGPREVAVMVRGKNGPPPPQELARLREELRRRGLKLSSLGIR